MKQRWEKLGQIYTPGTIRHPKLVSHAANPLPIHLDGDVYRVFFSGRDDQNRSSIGAVYIDILQRRVITEHQHPFFEHGPEGTFFADGLSIGNSYSINGLRYMLFMGWQAPYNEHWRGDIGRLIVSPNLATLKLDSNSPLMSSDTTDPISLSYPWVLNNYDSNYAMWYGSTKTWDAGNKECWKNNNFHNLYKIGFIFGMITVLPVLYKTLPKFWGFMKSFCRKITEFEYTWQIYIIFP